jgi:hypothetical protein
VGGGTVKRLLLALLIALAALKSMQAQAPKDGPCPA